MAGGNCVTIVIIAKTRRNVFICCRRDDRQKSHFENTDNLTLFKSLRESMLPFIGVKCEDFSIRLCYK